ncbi:MAG: autotransporter domain-containing protein [Verrucomicrobia bacterium]|nr:autotransporter domain-containing protein [Verrucomicrobiota bacterium]
MRKSNLITLISILINSKSLFAVSDWNGNTDGDWSIPTNWTPTTVPTDIATFPDVSTTQNITFSSSVPIGNMNFSSTIPYTFSPTSTETLTFTDNPSIINITVPNSGTYSISSLVSITTGLIVNLASNTTLTFTNVISGAGDLTLFNATGGLLNLGASNTYGGITNIQSGTLRLTASQAVPTDSAFSLGSTASLILGTSVTQASTNFSSSLGSSITLNNDATLILQPLLSATVDSDITGFGSLMIIPSSAVSVSLGGTSNYTGNTIIQNATVQPQNSTALGTGYLDLQSGTLDLTVSSYSFSGFSGTSGSSILLGANTLTINNSVSDVTIDSLIAGIAGSTLEKDGTETLNLGAINGFENLSIVNGTVSQGVLSAIPLNVNLDMPMAGGNLNLNGFNTDIADCNTSLGTNINLDTATLTINPTSASTTISGLITGNPGSILAKNGVNTLEIASSGNTYSETQIIDGTLLLSQPLALPSGAPLTCTSGGAILDLNASGNDQTIGDLTLVSATILLQGATLTINDTASPILQGDITGPGTIDKIGSGELTFYQGTNSFTQFDMSNGTTTLGQANIFPNNIDVNLTGGTFNLNNFDLSVQNLNANSSSTIDFGMVSNTLTLNATANATIDATIIGMNGILSKQGAFNLDFSGSHTYGTTIINGGTLTTTAPDTLPPTAAMTLTTGSLILNNNNQTVGTSTGSSGTTIDLGTATLTVASLMGDSTIDSDITGVGGSLIITQGTTVVGGANDYTGGTTIDGGALRGSVASGSLQGDFVLISNGSVIFDEAVNTSYSGQISGVGRLQKEGAGMLTLTGLNNIYTGGVSVRNGTLFAASSASLPNGSINIGGLGAELHIQNMNFTASSLDGDPDGILNLDNSALLVTGGGFFSSNIIGSGSVTYSAMPGEQLVLAGVSTYTGGTTIMSDGFIVLSPTALPPTNVSLTATGSVLLAADTTLTDVQASPGTALTFVAFPNLTLTFDGSGIANVDGNITEDQMFGATSGGVTKNGIGTVNFKGVNHYTDGLTITDGTVIGNTQNIPTPVNNAATLIFNQTTDAIYSGTITNALGTFRKQGSGSLDFTGNLNQAALFIDAGTLYVNNSITALTTTVASGATLGGVGPINGNVTVSGKVAPGNSIDTITVVGNYNQASGSTLEMEIEPLDADLLDVSGTVTIDNTNTTLALLFTPGSYSQSATYTLIQSGAPIVGKFAKITNNSLFLKPFLTYSNNLVLSFGEGSSFTSLIKGGNAGAIAACLQTATPATGSPLSNIIDVLSTSSSLTDAINTVNKLNPTSIKNLSLAQEETSFLAQNLIQNRLKQFLAVSDCVDQIGFNLWFDGTYEFSRQKSNQDLVGYNTDGGILALGLDFLTDDNFFLGTSFVYTLTSVHFLQSRGHGHVSSYSGNLYGGFYNDLFYIDLSLLGSYIDYTAHRHINVEPYYYSAYSSHSGSEFDGSLDMGFYWKNNKAYISPYISVDYIYLHEDGFHEKRAGNAGVSVSPTNYQVLRSFIGVNASFGYLIRNNPGDLEFGISYGYEARFGGTYYRAHFIDEACIFNVSGLNPSRFLVIPEITLKQCFTKANLGLFLNYQAALNPSFYDQSISLQILY